MSHAIVVDDLRFAWPGGAVLFDGIGFAVGPGRGALIGANGSGKSTLLRLIAGELVPSRGSVQVAGSLGWLRQDLPLAADLAVEEVLDITRARRALRAIEAGEAAAEHFAAVGDDWDVEERAHATLDRLGLRRLSQALAAYRARCWWPATTCRSCGRWGSPAGCAWTAGSPRSTRPSRHLGRASQANRSSPEQWTTITMPSSDEGDSDARSARGGPSVARRSAGGSFPGDQLVVRP